MCIGARGGCAPALGCIWRLRLGAASRCWSGPVGGGEGQMNQASGGVGGGRLDELPTDVPEIFESLQAPPDGAWVLVDPIGNPGIAGITSGLATGVEEQGRKDP